MRQFANIRLALGAAILGGVCGLAGGCSDTTNTGGYDDANADAADGFDPGRGSTSGSSDGSPGQSSDGGGSTGFEDESASGTEGGFGSTGGETGDGSPPADIGPFDACPEELPEGWIFCEDFEEAYNPAAVFFDYADSDGNFVPTFDGGASGLGAMKAHYREGVEGAGFMSVSFGANPINIEGRPGHASDDTFDEVYWRFRIRMQDGWPDAGPHNLTRISAFAQSNWGQAMVASFSSKGDDVQLEASAASCVQQGEVACAGIDDAQSLEPLGTLVGDTPVFSSGRGGQWQCIEAHVRLNTPGEIDGVFEMWVDGKLEGSSEGVDWRGSWSEFGLNLLSIENLWVGGAPADLDRWFDDLVISTQPIGCD
jgi:hypothetical protein